MRIALLVSSLRGGGAERVATTLANAWVARGHDVLLVPTFLADARSVYALDERVRLHGLGEWMPRWRLLHSPVTKWRALRRLLKEEQPDIAVSFLTNVNVMTLMACRGLDIPTVVCERSHPGASRSANGVLRLARRWLYPRAHVVTVQTAASAPALQAAAPGVHRIAVLPNPLPPELMAPPSDDAEPLHGRFRLVGMGRLVHAKRFDRLIDAFATLAPVLPHWDLYLWGEGPLHDDLQARAERAGVGGRVFLPGRTDTPWEVLGHADVVALTSDVEGFPNVLLEAMALGRACAAVDCPSGPRELSEDGQVALLVGRDDPQALQGALARLMSDAALRASLGAKAQQSVQQRFALPVVLAQWDDVFEQARRVAGACRTQRHAPASDRIEPTVADTNDTAAGRTIAGARQTTLAAPGPAVTPTAHRDAPDQARAQPQHAAAADPALRVCHVIGGLGLGGAEAVLFRLASTPTTGVRHEVVSLGGLGVYGPRLQSADVTVRALGLSRSPLSWPRGLAALWRLGRDWRRQPPDIVQTWMYHADLIGGLLARAARVPTVVWGLRNAGNTLTQSNRLSRFSQWLGARLSWRLPDRIVACSHDAAHRHAALGYDPARLRVVGNGYDLQRWDPGPETAAAWRAQMRASWGAGPDTVVLGLVARWHPLKDHATLLAALGQLTTRHWLCVLAGPGMDEDNVELVALLARHQLTQRVRLLGPRDDIPALMAGLDAHVLSSVSEGFPNVVAEAMAAGVPAVVTDVGDAARIVGNTGWVVPPRQPAALATALAEVIVRAGNGSLRERGERARARVQANYSLATMQQGFLEAWRHATHSRPPRLLFVVNNPAFFLSHRQPVADAARAAGYHVEVATMPGPAVRDIEALGYVHHAVALTRSGHNPLSELRALVGLWRLMRRRRPDLVHAVTIKPVLYGGMAARLAGVPAFVAAISGMGFLYTDGPRHASRRQALLRGVTSWLYRRALHHRNSRVIVQNQADADTLRAMGALRPGQTVLVPGSGVDLNQYPVRPEPATPPVVAVMAARLLADKGVREFAEAARLLWMQAATQPTLAANTAAASARPPLLAAQDNATQKDEPQEAGSPERGSDPLSSPLPATRVRFVLAGDVDPGNPASIDAEDVAAWQRQGIVEWVGHCDDVAGLYARSHIAVLPSYREGLPRSLAEAAACGRPVVTTDVPGCRDAIIPDQTGLLVPPGDADALARAIARLAGDATLRAHMGAAGRRHAERRFDVREIAQQHLRVYETLLKQRRTAPACRDGTASV